ncbi:hypothetical protein EXN66_Car003791 [Channa argus]|uniref:Uncharacterized protein n=2 Tax=Percomorphaceae TaxID=1489872 RepID=A0A6G1PD32_CHAAH|nr:hypothetical protein EXN66_Car003791 [Channa argus]
MELQQHFWRGAPGCRPRPQPIDGRLEPQPEIVNFSGGEIQPNPNFRHRSLLSGAELTSEQCNTKTLVELHVYQVTTAIKRQRLQLLQPCTLLPSKEVAVDPECEVSQRDATEKLAHQVAAQIAAADRRVEEASGDPHEEEKDEAHKSSKGHVSGKYGLYCMEERLTPTPTKTQKLVRKQDGNVFVLQKNQKLYFLLVLISAQQAFKHAKKP